MKLCDEIQIKGVNNQLIGKQHDPPLHLYKLKALMNRIPSYHPQYEKVKEQMAMQNAGHFGEKSLEFPLSFLEEKRFMIYHDLRISDGLHHFQIDTLVISQQYLLIIEVKNISGTLMFDPIFNQMIRISEMKEESFPNPLTQVERQRTQLQSFLSNLKLSTIPIETLIVVSNRSTVLKATQEVNAIASKVIRTEYLPTKVKSLDKRHTEERLSIKEVRKLGRNLLKNHEPLDRDVLKRFAISSTELLTGVACPRCSLMPMKRLHGRWHCKYCCLYSKDAHVKALNDYALLVSKEITNQKLREFLHIESISAASKMLSSMNLECKGTRKGRKYYLRVDPSKFGQ